MNKMRTATALLLLSLVILSGCAEPRAAPSELIQQPSQETTETTAPPAEDVSEAIDVVSADEVDIGAIY